MDELATCGTGRWKVQQHDVYYGVYIVWRGDFKFSYYWADSGKSRFIRDEYTTEEMSEYTAFLPVLDEYHNRRFKELSDVWQLNAEDCVVPSVRKGDFVAVDESPKDAGEAEVHLYFRRGHIGRYYPASENMDLSGLDGAALTLPQWNDFSTFMDFLRFADWKGFRKSEDGK